MALLDCHGIDEPMFALVDLVAHVLVVDTGAHAVLAMAAWGVARERQQAAFCHDRTKIRWRV